MIFALLLGITATMVWAAHRAVDATLVRAAGERAQTVADQVANLLDAERSGQQLKQLGHDPALLQFLQTRKAESRAAALARLHALAGTTLRRLEVWSRDQRELEVVTPDLAPPPGRPRTLPPGRPPFVPGISALAAGSDVVYSDSVAEIRAGTDGQVLGYLLIRSTFSENPPGIFSRLVGRNALVRVGNRQGQIWTDFSGAVPPAPVDLNRAGVAQYVADNGQHRIGAVAPVRGAPWAAWVEFPQDVVTAPAQTFLNQIVPVSFLFVALGAVLAAFVSGRITTPLSTLSGVAEAIASGDYSQRVSTNRLDEIGQLGDAFNHMSEEVKQTHERLETRVIERTAELSAARIAADRANQAKSEFLSRMSHELRTPLNAVMGFAQVLQLDSLTAEQHDGLSHILRGGRHLLGLINEVLDVARIEAGALSLSLEPVAIADLALEAVNLIRPLAARRGLTIQVDPMPATFALADRQRLNQILFNLLSNAVKYNRPGGSIRVFSPSTEPDRVAIVISDTGAGIPAEKLALLFKPFERLGAEQSDVEGTGLGLALAKGLAEAMSGSLTVKSTIDDGSSFCVELPAAQAPALLPDGSERLATPASGSAGTIVYIEDNLSNVRLMERLVQRRPGVSLIHARDGSTGVALVQERRPSLVFLDLHLPDCSGEEVLRQLWENPDTREIPVAVLSADAMPSQHRRLLAAGARMYFTKPFDIAEVLHFIDETFDALSSVAEVTVSPGSSTAPTRHG
jgi:signal transduction histidine kinase/CheY-like chemotaxis protein